MSRLEQMIQDQTERLAWWLESSRVHLTPYTPRPVIQTAVEAMQAYLQATNHLLGVYAWLRENPTSEAGRLAAEEAIDHLAQATVAVTDALTAWHAYTPNQERP